MATVRARLNRSVWHSRADRPVPARQGRQPTPYTQRGDEPMIKVLSSTFGSRAARVIATILAITVLLVQGFLLYRWEAYTDCVGRQATAASDRARALSEATDLERVAERDLLSAPSAAARDRVVQ